MTTPIRHRPPSVNYMSVSQLSQNKEHGRPHGAGRAVVFTVNRAVRQIVMTHRSEAAGPKVSPGAKSESKSFQVDRSQLPGVPSTLASTLMLS